MSDGNIVYSVTQMTVRILDRFTFSSKPLSLRNLITKERKLYRTRNTNYWGTVHRYIFEIQKRKITIEFVESMIGSKNLSRSIKSFIDVITYWMLWNEKGRQTIINEINSFSFSNNKNKRKVIRYFEDLKRTNIKKIVNKIGDFTLRWSIKYSLPSILFQHLQQYYTYEELEELGNYSNKITPKYIWINQTRDDKPDIKHLKSKTNLTAIEAVQNTYLIEKGRPIQHLGEYNQGKIMIQDIGAIIVSQLIPVISKGNIIDLCASPGNKTIHIIEKYRNLRQVNIYATDLPGSRYQLFTKRLQFLLGLKPEISEERNTEIEIQTANKNITLLPRDATDTHFKDNFFDLIFIDAPCTGSGTIGTKPDTRNHIDAHFIREHVQLQEKILQESHRILKPEGFLFYVTCSLIEEENESQISTFIKKYKNYNLIQLDHVLADNSKLLPEAIRLFPPKTNSEGFFACLLRKARKP